MIRFRIARPACSACCRWPGATGALLGAAFLVVLGVAFGRSAQEKPAAPQKGGLPADLERVPADAPFLVSLRVADLWNSEAIKALRQQKGQELEEGLKFFEKEIGVGPAAMERVTVVVTDFRSKGPLVFITTVQPFDRAKILSTALPGAKPENPAAIPGVKVEKRKEQLIFVSAKNQAVFFLSERSYLIGPADEVRAYLDGPAAREGALSGALQLAGQKHQLVAGFNVAGFAREAGGQLPPEADAFRDLLKAHAAIWSVDLGEQMKAALRLEFADEVDAKRADKALRAAIDLARVVLAQAGQEVSREPDAGRIKDLLKLGDAALQTATLTQKGADLQVTLNIKADVPTVVATVVEGLQKVRQAANRMKDANNLKQIALAMHNYHDTYGHFPPQAIYSKDGKPLLSWRVLLLPFLEQDNLYKQFKLDEAWDSPHNQKLLAQMPKLFGDPDVKTTEPETVYQAFVGPDALFEGDKGVRIADITDGTSNTIMIAEAAKPVPWTKPEDLPYDPKKPLPKLGGHTPGGFNAAFCDGSVHFLRQNIKEAVLRALITRNGGEVIDQSEF